MLTVDWGTRPSRITVARRLRMLRYGFLALLLGWILLIVEAFRWLLHARWEPYSLERVFALIPDVVADGLAALLRAVCQVGLWALIMLIGVGLVLLVARPRAPARALPWPPGIAARPRD